MAQILEDLSKRALSILLALSITACAGPASVPVKKSEAAFPPGYSTTRTGDVHDFDYFAGGWTTHQRRLRTRGIGSTEWEEFPATLCMSLYLGGMATVDELYFPTKGWAGLTLRTFDLEKRQWSIYWVSSASGKMDVPVVGGFDGNHGEFYGEDRDNGRPVKVRYTWNKVDRSHARWEQAFSYDNRTWETNWTADFVRADPATTCEAGRPKRQAEGVTIHSAPPGASSAADEQAVAALDTQYQAAVAKGDAAAMDRILADDFVLVTGKGKVFTKADLLNEARGGKTVYERQEDSSQKVRVWGDTAVVTALLWEKGAEDGKPFEYRLWFSDTYVRTSTGWRYVFGQASIPLPGSK